MFQRACSNEGLFFFVINLQVCWTSSQTQSIYIIVDMSSLVITFLLSMLFMHKVHTAQISVSYGAVLSIKLITCHLVWADVYLWHCLQVPYALNYSLIFYFVTNEEITEGSLLHQFISGDDTFRNSRLSLIPAIPEVSVYLHHHEVLPIFNWRGRSRSTNLDLLEGSWE